jgi:thioredoxin-dependent peroxiredoxin
MATVTFKGQSVHTAGELPAVGSKAPAFRLTAADLSDVGLEKFAGKRKILSIAHSLDTGTCQVAARRFNQEVSSLGDTVLLSITADLPFAAKRFCDSEKLANVVVLSCFRSPSFGKDYGVAYTDGPLVGLLARSVVVLSADNRVVHTEQVQEVTREPNYDAALAAVKKAS